MSKNNLPAVVNPSVDLGYHPDQENESWYLTALVTAGEHQYGLLVHFLRFGTASEGVTAVSVSVTGEELDLYSRNELALSNGAGLSTNPGIDIRTDIVTWTGDAGEMKIDAKLPNGGFELSLRSHGGILYNLGSGSFAMYGDTRYLNYQVSLPHFVPTGTLTLDGRTETVSGWAWVDRQWGPLPGFGKDFMWTWLNFVLPNGDRISLWDNRAKSRHTWATILQADGTHIVAEASLTTKNEDLWQSPESGERYATHWSVSIPSLKGEFEVIANVARQELMVPAPRYEGLAAFKGQYKDAGVSGHCYVETGPVN